MGSVSIASWQLACTTVVVLVSDMIRGLLSLVLSTKTPTKTKEAPVKADSEKPTTKASAKVTTTSEKEDKKKA